MSRNELRASANRLQLGGGVCATKDRKPYSQDQAVHLLSATEQQYDWKRNCMTGHGVWRMIIRLISNFILIFYGSAVFQSHSDHLPALHV